jgi:hypothetical protein
MCEPEPLLEAISSGADPVRLWDIATAWLAERGFDRVIHMSVGPPGRDPELRTTMPEHFLRTYAAASNGELFERDPGQRSIPKRPQCL